MKAVLAFLKTWLESAPGRHTCVVLGLLIAVIGIAAPASRSLAERCAKDWLGGELALLEQPYAVKSAAKGEVPVRLLPVNGLEPDVVQRLAGQANEARRGAAMHLQITQFFFVRYYMFTSVAAGLALLSAICFAFISLKGWAAASPYLATGFIVLSALTTYFSAMPALYQQTQNIDNNKRLYADYRAVIADIETYAAAGPPETPEVAAPAAFMRKVDERLAQLRSLPLAFNTSVLKEMQSSLATTPDGRHNEGDANPGARQHKAPVQPAAADEVNGKPDGADVKPDGANGKSDGAAAEPVP